jgi:arylsulfatase A-like enzyme
VPSNFANDYPVNQTTFYTLLKQKGYHTMTTGKDDLTKATGCNINGTLHATALGFVDFLRVKGKDDVLGAAPSDPYGEFLLQHNTTVGGKTVTLWDVYNKLDGSCCTDVPGSGGGYYCETPTAMPQEAYEDDYVAGLALALLDRKPPGQPWFLQVSFPGPHPPFIVTSSMNTTTSEAYPSAVDNAKLSRADNEAIRQLYAAELEHLDTLFATVLAKVDALGDRDNTVVIVASDHGEMLGDHADWGKTMPWQGSVSVPLIASAPALGVRVATVQGTPVATMDIAGTLLELAGAVPAQGMTTRSFANVLKGAPGSAYERPFVSSGLANWRMVVQTQGPRMWKYICCQGACPGAPSNATGTGAAALGFVDEEWRAAFTQAGKEETGEGAAPTRLLYDVMTDAFDERNLLAEYPAVGAALEALLPKGFCT